MALSATPVERRIVLKRSTGEVVLKEPYPNAPIEAVRAFNQADYPELATCGVDTSSEEVKFKPDNGPETSGTRSTTSFKPNAGTRG